MLTDGKAESWPASSTGTRFIVFRCPTTGLEVQTSILEAVIPFSGDFQGLMCVACTRLHSLTQEQGRSSAQRYGHRRLGFGTKCG
jgi:hypothetical protein